MAAEETAVKEHVKHNTIVLGEKSHQENVYLGASGWLSGLKPLPLAHVMLSVSWDRAPHQALCSVGSLLPLSHCLPLCLLVICQIHK